MSYYFNTALKEISFDEAVVKTKEALKEEGFGVLSEINMQDTMKKKLDVDIEKYMILGACNPSFAYKALQNEDKVGLMLPCNIIVQDKNEVVEISAVDPIESMKGINNPALETIANEVREKLKKVIAAL